MFGGTGLLHFFTIFTKGIAMEPGCFFPTDLKSPEHVHIFQYKSSLTMGFHLPNGTPGFFVSIPTQKVSSHNVEPHQKCSLKMQDEKKKIKTNAEKNHLLPFSKRREEQHTGRAGGDSGTRTIGSLQCNPNPGHNPSEAVASHEQSVVVVIVG